MYMTLKILEQRVKVEPTTLSDKVKVEIIYRGKKYEALCYICDDYGFTPKEKLRYYYEDCMSINRIGKYRKEVTDDDNDEDIGVIKIGKNEFPFFYHK